MLRERNYWCRIQACNNYSNMARERKELRQGLSTLSIELKVTLGFKEESQQKEWLIHDEIASVGGYVDFELYEWLPTRARVRSDGTRYEVGVRNEDLEGLLALAKIINPQCQGLDHVKNFWKDHPKFSVKEEEGWMYIGTNMDPTPMDFEMEYDPAQDAYDLTLIATIGNMTYEQMKNHERYGDDMKEVEDPEGQKILFSRIPEGLEQMVADGYERLSPSDDRLRVISITRKKLDEAGYPEVEIDEDQVWKVDSDEEEKGWQIFTRIKYERDGRKIIRHAGIPFLNDNGEVDLNLFPREYIEFRYK